MSRSADFPVHEQFINRWSPRSFLTEPVPSEHLQTILEAARFAPSCANEQPWLFHIFPGNHSGFIKSLDEGNATWARNAPVAGFVSARLDFASGKPNAWAEFDCGAALLSAALQSNHLGYYMHVMGGFNRDEAALLTGASDRIKVVAAFVLGKQGDPTVLPEHHRKREAPNGRKPQSEFVKFME